MGAALQVLGCIQTAVQLCNEVYKVVNEPVSEEEAYLDEGRETGEIYVLICALDYKRTSNPLTCTIDGQNVQKLLSACGVPRENITVMYDEQCTKEAVLEAISEVGGQCGEGDYFVFYYSGHGTSIKDYSGDEADGKDEAFCFVTDQGQITYDSLLSDDDFAEAVTSGVSDDAKIIILTDCCHSGTIADFKSGGWENHKAISIAGCTDEQTSGDIGRGGIFTHSMLLAIAELASQGETDYTVGRLYNTTLAKDDAVFNSAQDIAIQCSPGMLPKNMAWPLVPQGGYTPPYGRRSLE
mmetsp:Transcript_49341/g.104962  ORF Transcript_49341/g.104962 Transcript_49341/m.104962 type:complete len:296 (+) Transcript_49341:107-994(+)